MLMKTHCLVSNREGLGTSPFITRPIYGSQSEHIEISNILKFGSGSILNEQTVYLNENCRYTARFLACENIRFSSLFVAEDVSRETSSATKSEEKRMFSQATRF